MRGYVVIHPKRLISNDGMSRMMVWFQLQVVVINDIDAVADAAFAEI